MAAAPNNGQIFTELAYVRNLLENMQERNDRADDQARDYREKIYAKLEANSTRTTIIEERLTTISQRVGQMEPTVTGLTNLRQRAGGVILALGVAGTILGAILTNIVGWFSGRVH